MLFEIRYLAIWIPHSTDIYRNVISNEHFAGYK